MSSSSPFITEYRGNSLIITIPSKKNWPLFFFTSSSLIFSVIFLLAISAFMGLIILLLTVSVVAGESAYEAMQASLMCLFFVPALLVVSLLTGYALYTVLWYLSGREIIQVTHHFLTIRREILGICRPKKFRPRHIRNFRVLSEKTNHLTNYFLFGSFWVYFSTPKGKIAFDHPFGTYRFGMNLETDEANTIIATIREYFPEYGNV